jgi:hypothetical protein
MHQRSIKNLVDGLTELSDEHLQSRLWTGKIEGQMSSFTEAMCSVFDDSGFQDTVENQGQYFGLSIDNQILDLGNLAQSIDQNIDPAELVETLEMRAIRALAQHILLNIRKLDKN